MATETDSKATAPDNQHTGPTTGSTTGSQTGNTSTSGSKVGLIAGVMVSIFALVLGIVTYRFISTKKSKESPKESFDDSNIPSLVYATENAYPRQEPYIPQPKNFESPLSSVQFLNEERFGTFNSAVTYDHCETMSSYEVTIQ